MVLFFSINPSLILTENGGFVNILQLVDFSPIFLNNTGFSVAYFTGHEPKSILSGNSNKAFWPIALIGTINFSLSVTISKSY